MKNKKIIMLFIFIIFIFFGMSKLKASTWTCTYKSETPKIIKYILYVDSQTGLKTDRFEHECENGNTGANSFTNKQKTSYTICGFGFSTSYFTSESNMKKINERFKVGNEYGCPDSPFAFSSGTNIGTDTRYFGLPDEFKNKYPLQIESAVNNDPSKTYTCGDSKLSENGTCPEGQKCILDGSSQDGGYKCVTKTGDEAYEEVCSTEAIVPRKAYGVFTSQCYHIQYKKKNGIFQPVVRKYSDGENCSGTLSATYAVSINPDINQWFIMLGDENQKNPDMLIMPQITDCSKAPTSEDLKFNDKNIGGQKYLFDPEGEFQVPKGSEKDCSEILGTNGQLIVKAFIMVIRIITPILLFTFTAFEFMKAIPQQDEDAIIKAWKRFGTRGVIAAIIMLLPTFMNLIGKIIGDFDSCGIW